VLGLDNHSCCHIADCRKAGLSLDCAMLTVLIKLISVWCNNEIIVFFTPTFTLKTYIYDYEVARYMYGGCMAEVTRKSHFEV
jgi:hypothetical protein